MRRGNADRARQVAQRLRRMHDWLVRAYGPQRWWPADTAFEVILGAYLTQNTSWKAVQQSLANLRSADALTIEGLRRLSIPELVELIRPSGFYTRKAPALKAFVARLDRDFDGSLDRLAAMPTGQLRDWLLALPGVGLETADAILLYALGHRLPMADEYLRRVVERHRLLEMVPGKNRKGYESLVTLTLEAFAKDPAEEKRHLFGEFHALIVAVGKAHCSKKAKCTGCPLADDPHVSIETIQKQRNMRGYSRNRLKNK
jgi:endonuclease III related protein